MHNLGGPLAMRQFGATLLAFSISVIRAPRVQRGRKTRCCCGRERWNDAAHIRSNAAYRVPICNDRHNFATGTWPADANERLIRKGIARQPDQNDRTRPGFSRLPNSWAKAGAFSLLTQGSKLAQY